tara:strand:- start:808 stop:1101 length:294 start_codon:yes stop_codon:yes gene_type:complete
MKKGPLSNKEKKFIDNNEDMPTDQMSKKLDRSVSTITKYIKNNGSDTATHDLFARKEDRGVTVMTESASSQADENKQKRKTSTPRRYTGVIHKIKED